jgi:hypothetical protein
MVAVGQPWLFDWAKGPVQWLPMFNKQKDMAVFLMK